MPYDVAIEKQGPCGMLLLRGDVSARAKFSTCLGMDIPQAPNTVSSAGERSVLWLGPEEWLLVTSEKDEAHLASELLQTVEGVYAAVIIVSDCYTVLNLSGTQSLDVLAQGYGIDIFPEEFIIGQCVCCAFARTTAILRPFKNAGIYQLIVESSYASYIELWLRKAAGF